MALSLPGVDHVTAHTVSGVVFFFIPNLSNLTVWLLAYPGQTAAQTKERLLTVTR